MDSTPQDTQSNTKKLITLAVAASVGSVLLLLIITGGGYYLYTNYARGYLNNVEAAYQSRAIVAEAGRVVLLPKDDTPTVSLISDTAQLQDIDSFYTRGKVGDALISYNNTGIIILFDRKAQKVVMMGLAASSTLQQATSTTAASVPTDLAALAKQVNKLVETPQQETPEIVPVTDAQALSGNAFFIRATAGDMLAVYKQNGEAALYDPVLKKIINLSAVTATDETQ